MVKSTIELVVDVIKCNRSRPKLNDKLTKKMLAVIQTDLNKKIVAVVRRTLF